MSQTDMESKLKPALISGVGLGVLSGFPLIECLCCIWVIGGGVLAVYLYQRELSAAIQYGDGAILGLMTGAIGGVVASVISGIFGMIFGQSIAEFTREVFESQGDVPPWVEDMLASGASFTLIEMLFSVIIFAIFATVGAVIGVAIFQKKAGPPPAQPMAPGAAPAAPPPPGPGPEASGTTIPTPLSPEPEDSSTSAPPPPPDKDSSSGS